MRVPLDTPFGLLVCSAITGLSIAFTAAAITIDLRPAERVILIVGAIGALCLSGFFWLVRKAHIRARRALNGLCVHCGYDLRGSGELCPECGRANPIWAARNHPSSAAESIVRAEIDSVSLRFKRIETILFNAVLGSGVFALVEAYAIATEKRGDPHPWPRSWLVATVLLFVIFLGSLIAVNRRGERRLRKLRRADEAEAK